MSLDTYSICFTSCRNVYPVKLVRPVNKYKVNEQDPIGSILKDINNNDLIIDSAIFDKIKRSVARCAKSHAGYYACEYCEAAAQLLGDGVTQSNLDKFKKKIDLQRTSINRQLQSIMDKPSTTGTLEAREFNIQLLRNALVDLDVQESDELKKTVKKQLCWPFQTRKGKLRTLTSIHDIIDRIEEEGPLDRDEAKGFIGKSHFLNQPHFHFINDMNCEYMHLVCLGLVKRLISLTFRVGENRDRVTKRKLSDPALFNVYILEVQSPREYSRRCRSLDFSVLKAQEYRNIILCFFPLVIKCIEPEFTDEIKMWYNIVFVVRACILPNSEFEAIPESKIKSACETFFRLFEKLYGKKNCSYSVHVVASHILLIRGNEPLTFRSAFKFESFFAEMKKMYAPGTSSTVKQILQNCYMKRLVECHSCQKTIFYQPKKKKIPGKKFNPGLENNYLIYVKDENNDRQLYQIIGVDETDSNVFTCIRQGKFEINNPLTPNLNWSDVGVYKVGPTNNEQLYSVNRNEISGKIVKVDNYLITCPLNVLQEK